MSTSVSVSVSSCKGSSSRLLVYIDCKRPMRLGQATGKSVPSYMQQKRLGHTWISGHPHSILYKPFTPCNKTAVAGKRNNISKCSTGTSEIHGLNNNGSSSSFSSFFLDFAGNSRYQAYNLARFSTFSVASSPSSPASSLKASSSIKTSETKDTDATQGTGDKTSTGSSTEGSHSNSATADSQSPSTSTSTTAFNNEQHYDDKDDAWAVNESYSGHSGHSFSSLSTPTATAHPDATSESSSSTSISNGTISSSGAKDEIDVDYKESQVLPQPSMSSFKTPAAIQASWHRTSESLPSVTTPNGTSVLSNSSSKAGGLDLSSSTLVQQMLFKERVPHVDSSDDEENSWRKSNQENFTDNNEPDEGTAITMGSSAVSPSLTSMILNQGNSAEPHLSDAVTAIVKDQNNKAKAEDGSNEEDHISKLDIRVGIVRSVSAHPGAESLYIEQVDLGDKEADVPKEPRTIVSGLVRYVPKDYLEGRAVIVVGNMKPSKLRGVVSEGMLLCAMEQDLNGEVIKVGLLEPAEGSRPGDKITFEGYTDEATIPAAVLTPKRKWFEKSRVHFYVKNGVAYYKGSPFKSAQGLVRCKTISEGQIS